MPEVDWKFKVSDVVRLIVLGAMIVIGYVRLDDRVTAAERTNVELGKTLRDTTQKLEEALVKQNEVAVQALIALKQINYTLQQYPPHRHTHKGDIIYPNAGGVVGAADGGH